MGIGHSHLLGFSPGEQMLARFDNLSLLQMQLIEISREQSGKFRIRCGSKLLKGDHIQVKPY